MTAGLGSDDLPAFFASADAHSLRWQNRFLNLQRLQLGALVLAGVGGATDWVIAGGRASAVAAALGFAVAAIARIVVAQQQPERRWYDGRAAAESAKTLAWRFAVCGEPFSRSLSEKAAVSAFTERILELTRDLPSLDRPAGQEPQVSEAMKRVRSMPLGDRQAAYDSGRLGDQQAWYSRKSRWNERRSAAWNIVLVTLDVGAIAAALMRIAGWIDIDLLGIVATVSAVGVAWVQAKQHELLSRSYAVASQELSAIRDRMTGVRTEVEWAEAMEQAEEAISREHTLWRASRSSLR